MLPVGSAFLVLFSEKFPSYRLVDVRCMNADVYPDFRPCRFNDVHICSMKGPDTAWGRFAVLLDLTRDEHLLFYLSRKSRLAGDFGDVVSYQVLSSGVQSLLQRPACLPKSSRMVLQGLPPWGVRAHLSPAPGAGKPILCCKPHLKTGSSIVVSHLPGRVWSQSPCP